MRSLSVIQTTIDDKTVLDSLITRLLEKKLVACAQVSTIQSSFWWKEAIQTTDEFILVLKLPSENKNQVIGFIEKNHSYEVPEIIIEDKKTTELYYEYCHEACDI